MNSRENKFIELITDLITHEFKTPISTISGFTEILNSGINIDENKRNEYTKLINEQSHYLSLMTDCIIDLGKMEINNFRITKSPVNLGESISKILKKMNRLNQTEFIKNEIRQNIQINVDERKIGAIVELTILLLKKSKNDENYITINDEIDKNNFILNFSINTNDEIKTLIQKKFSADNNLKELSHENPASVHWIKKILEYHNGQTEIISDGAKTIIKFKIRTD